MSERVLVAGGAGYIGSHAAKALAASGREPVVVDNLSGGFEKNVRWGPLHKCDIRDTERLSAIMKEVRPAAVMHFAASIEVGVGERAPLSFYDNNVAGAVSMLKAMRAAGVENLVFSSTCAVYGDAKPPLCEATPRAPASVYGRTKAMMEQVIEDCARAEGLNAAILRYFNACGADPDGEIGEEHDPETHLIPNALKAAAGIGQGLKVFGDDYPTPDGTCLRDYIHVTDLAAAHVAALDKLSTGGGVLTLNLGTGRPYSVLEVVEAIARVTGRRPPVEMAPRRAGDVPVLTADVSQARDMLGLAPQYSDIDTVIETAWAFHRRVWGL